MALRLVAAAAVAAASLAVPASADPLNGCRASGGSTCEFVATGDVRYVIAGLAGCTITIYRNWTQVYSFSGNVPPTGVITEAEAGDVVEVYGGFPQNVTQQTVCYAGDAQ